MRLRPTGVFILNVAVTGAVLAVSANAATWRVPSECPTIQAGVDSAGVGDTVLVACDTYYEHDIIMKSGICLTSETGEADCVTIDAQQQGRVIYCKDVGGAASIVGFTVVGGVALGGRAGQDSAGGGLYCENSSPALTGCLFVDNEAVYGGGMGCWTNANSTLANCSFSGNEAIWGGGMFCYLNADVTLTDCTFSNNTAGVAGGGMGCAIGCFATLTGCTFTGNSGDDGGGMMSFMCWPTLTDCTFEENTATSVGGGMTSSESFPTFTGCTFKRNSATESGGGLRLGASELAILDDCAFIRNTASEGGGVWIHSGGNLALAGPGLSGVAGPGVSEMTPGRSQGVFTGCRFGKNEATYGGGLCCIDESKARLTNCTFDSNTAYTLGAGVYCDNIAEVTLENCIIAFSFQGRAVACGGGSVTLSCSDVYGNSGGDWFDCIWDQASLDDNFWADPLFCGPDSPDDPLSLHDDSPCCAENNPVCGQVGACGIGCATPVEMIGWGSIKAMFR